MDDYRYKALQTLTRVRFDVIQNLTREKQRFANYLFLKLAISTVSTRKSPLPNTLALSGHSTSPVSLKRKQHTSSSPATITSVTICWKQPTP